MTNDFCKKKLANSKKDEKKKVAKTIVSKPGVTPAGTPSVSNSEGKGDQEYEGQAIYHCCQQVHHGSRTPRVDYTVSTTLSDHKKGFTKQSLPDTVAKKMNLKMDTSKVKLSVEGKTQLFSSVPGGAIKRVRAIVSRSVGKEFLIGWKDQDRLGILHKNWPNIPDTARAVRSNKDDEEWPKHWPQEVRDVLEEYADVFADKLTT